MTGHNNSAVSKTEHGNKDAEINDCLYDPQQSIFPFKQITVPLDIQDIVRNEQLKLSCP